MTQEKKELLLKDLCARLPYGVFVEYDYDDGVKRATKFHGNHLYLMMLGKLQWKDFKPYLRPMSSITEEEMKEYERLHKGIAKLNDIAFIALNDFLNSHHFDYRGLIPLGLAIEVTKENNPYKD